jgi:phosphoribosyl 1,2-cyclic phosphodiesterase
MNHFVILIVSGKDNKITVTGFQQPDAFSDAQRVFFAAGHDDHIGGLDVFRNHQIPGKPLNGTVGIGKKINTQTNGSNKNQQLRKVKPFNDYPQKSFKLGHLAFLPGVSK